MKKIVSVILAIISDGPRRNSSRKTRLKDFRKEDFRIRR